MSDFSFIKRLDEAAEAKKNEDPNAPKIKYERYDIEVAGKDVGVLIPVRECEAFEQSLSKIQHLSEQALRGVVREHRGIRIQEHH